jgi:hypothetical protein
MIAYQCFEHHKNVALVASEVGAELGSIFEGRIQNV